MRRRLPILAALFVSACPAWGPEGHEITARIAEGLLDPAVKARVAAVLRPGESTVSVAGWADSVRQSRRQTGAWHYINAPISRRDIDLARDCRDGDCVVARLGEFIAELRNPNTSARRRREALMFVVHLAGDINQPLHAADNGDQGGNQITVSYFGRRTNLHSLWDGGVLRRMGSADALAAGLAAAITPQKRSEWSRGTPERWAAEAHEAAREVAYGRLPQFPKGRTIVLSEPYARFAEPVVRTQLQKAGVRIAAALKQALGR
jgi:hypothetical protein